MAEILAVESDAREVWARDRRKAALAARLLACCLGIPAEPGFDLAGQDRGGYQRTRPYAMGECVFKDASDDSPDEECGRLQLLLVDEHGNVLAQSKETHPLGNALDLLERLPLRVSPHADGWLKNALGEPGPAAARPSPGAAQPFHALEGEEPELKRR